jgi:hypothetical protein
MSWNKFSLPSTGTVSPKTGVAAVSRIPNSMEVWYVGAEGSIEDSFWYDGGTWQHFQLAPPASASLTGGIAAVSRISNSMEVWHVGLQGSIEDHFWYDGANWQGFQLAPSGSAALTSHIAAVSRIPNSMELWWIGQDGSVQGAFWYEGGNWTRYQLAPPGSASLTGGIAAVSRIPNSMELWYVGAHGSIEDCYWYEGGNWQTFQLAPPGSASLTGSIAAVSRIPNSMELWYTGVQGSIEDCFWYEGGNWQHFQLAPPGSASLTGGIAAVSRIPNSMEVWHVGPAGSVEDHFWYEGGNWQNFQLAPPGSASTTTGIAVVSRIPSSMELWCAAPAGGSMLDNFWYQDAAQLPTLSGANNSMLINNCVPLQNVGVKLAVAQDLVTYQDVGFSLQLNCYPPAGQLSQGQTLNWLQYIIYVQSGTLYYEIQYWALNGPSKWPPGYTPNPNTTPWLPVFPNDYFLTPFGSAANNRIPRGSTLTIQLTTDQSGNVTNAQFTVAYPGSAPATVGFPFPQGTQYPIDAFEVNLVGPGNFSNATFISGAGTFTYNTYPGTLTIQSGGPGSKCNEVSNGTGENSNIIYGAITPSGGGPTLTQSVSFIWQGTAAASGSDLDGYWGSDSSQHVNYVSIDGHVHELFYHPNATWIDNDLTVNSKGAAAAPGSAVHGYWGSDSSQHVNFTSLDGHVHELYYHPGSSAWVDNDLTANSKGAAAAPGTDLDGYWGSDNSQHVNFTSIDGHVHELYYHPGSTAWVDNDLTANSHGAPAAPGTDLDGYWGSDSSQHVNFTSIDGHVHELFYHPGSTAWADNDLTVVSKGTPAAAVRPHPEGRFHSMATGSALDGYWGSDNSQHVNFVSVDGHVHELYIAPGANWVDNDLTAHAHGALAAPGSALDGYWGSDNSQHVNFISADGHVHELFYHIGATDWVDNDLTANAHGTPAVPGSPLDGYWGSDNSQHVNFLSVDGHIHELYYHPGSTNWVDNDLTAQT